VTAGALTFEASVDRITSLAASRGGTVSAADVESDELLARDPATTSAAAHLLAGGTDVRSQPADDSSEWFPYAQLTFAAVAAE
jgi:hypothetical protein